MRNKNLTTLKNICNYQTIKLIKTIFQLRPFGRKLLPCQLLTVAALARLLEHALLGLAHDEGLEARVVHEGATAGRVPVLQQQERRPG